MGFDNGSIEGQAIVDGLVSFYDYSQASKTTIASEYSPSFIVTAGQTNLLLAEARFRGWISSGTAAEYFAVGIEQSLKQVSLFNASVAIPDADISAYVAANSLNTGTEMEQINSQYWVSSIMNGEEAWANFRRTDYPNIAPNPYPGREVEWIYRLTYPDNESSVNSENFAAMIAMQGADKLDLKLWWDN